MKTNIQICLFVILPLLFLIAGCGGDKGPAVYSVTGTVYLDDAPLADCRVIFSPKALGDGTETDASGRTDANGVYKIQTTTGKVDGGTTPGKYAVSFSKSKEIWDGKSYREGGPPGTPPIKDSRSVEVLPKIYTSQRTSPESATVTNIPKQNQFDFHLKSK